MHGKLLYRSPSIHFIYIIWVLLAVIAGVALSHYPENPVGMTIVTAIMACLIFFSGYWKYSLYEDMLVLKNRRLAWFLNKTYTYPIHSITDMEVQRLYKGQYRISITLEGHKGWIMHKVSDPWNELDSLTDMVLSLSKRSREKSISQISE